ncbi:large subunit ribosomal protein L13 [Anaerobranca californiensis DSM 14826]|uniref:Large ribosomal subunit protein uL13 n=1 Tax=Anaerobranca californiensis DSM 14826 TaxID=1120989 RepID=A0A1M6MZ71_9FIRM|nr:50S ribosomal protein L13 [Anaerobranca californiensis]SHJ88623.1 large subunit ribosomal protein L13 [Anaerobranca californiensis DSM 14826]
MRTTFLAKANEVERKWYVVDAEGKTLGRLASEVATILRGKHKAIYTPNVDTGDHVIIINAEKAVLTGNKLKNKIHYRHSNYPGGLKATTYEVLMKEKPERALYLAVKGMLPHNKLGRKMLKKLRVYRGPHHNHEAQQPQMWQPRGF